MSICPDYYTLNQLLTNRLFRIPDYQRVYSWQDQHRGAMFNDIRSLRNMPADSFHFMATVVEVKRHETKIVDKVYDHIEIVDGQQRITTLVLLIKAIEQGLRCEIPDENESAKELQELLVKEDEASLILLQTNHDRSQYFTDFLKSGGYPSVDEATTLADRELLKAIEDCESFLKEWNDLIELLEIIKHNLTFVYYEIDYKPAVYTVFETLNDRGLDVSWLDKLKTRLMWVAFTNNHGNNDEHIDTLQDIWGCIYAAIGLNQDLIKEALTFGAVLISSDIVRRSISEKKAVSYFVERCDNTISGALEISRWILRVTEAFTKFLDQMSSKGAVTKITHARLLGLAITMRDCSPEERKKLFEAWEKATFRIFGLCRTDGRKEKSKYVSLAWKTVNATELDGDEILTQIQKLDAGYSVDKTLIENRNCYRNWEEQLRYLLFRYEEYLTEQQGRTISDKEWELIWNATASRSIEHILPQSKSSQVADQEGVFVHRLGNLLLLPLDINSELGNEEPKKKASRYQETGFLMAAEVAKTINKKREWGVEQIEEREQKLIEWICEEWS